MRALLAALALAMMAAACGQSAPAPASSPPQSPSATVQPSVLPSASGPPSGFTCGGSFAGGAGSAGSAVADVRVGAQAGYDRFVVEFKGDLPAWRVEPHTTTFVASPSGIPFTVAGTGAVLVWLQPVVDWTSFSSPQRFQPGYPYLREARLVENFEAIQQWALGVQGAPCLRVTTLTAPTRLVVDVVGS